MNTIVSTLNAKQVALSKQTKAWFAKKAERAVVSLFSFALEHESVQRVVVQQMTESGRMCRALREATEELIEERTTSIEVDADNVSGLDSKIESELENYLEDREIDADTISGLDNVVEQAVEDKLADAITEALDERLAEEVQKALGEKLNEEFSVEALTDMIANRLADRLRG